MTNKTDTIGTPLYMYDVVTSTFDKAAEFEPSHGLTVAAKRQTNGRGRLGRQWQSDTGGIYMSIYLKASATMHDCSATTVLCAVAVAKALGKYGNCRIKWPNDIVMNGKKICGILSKSCIQNGIAQYACVGIGINVNTACFPAELPYASSILAQTGTTYDEEEILHAVLSEIDNMYSQPYQEIIQQYKELCITLGADVIVHYADGSDKLKGRCTGITDTGELIVKTNNQETTVNSGEVSVRGLYGYI